jgi:hypothetical protein
VSAVYFGDYLDVLVQNVRDESANLSPSTRPSVRTRPGTCPLSNSTGCGTDLDSAQNDRRVIGSGRARLGAISWIRRGWGRYPAPVSRGIVLWPDSTTSWAIRDLWEALATQGLPSMATHTHGRHEPHVSLIVADHLPVNASLGAVAPVPRQPIRLLIEAAGVFPGDFLFLACVANKELLDEQRRVHQAIRPLVVDPWPYFEPGTWTPHVTTGWELTRQQLAESLPLVLDHLPIAGWLDRGGVEDGTTGENWTSPDESALQVKRQDPDS